MTLAVTFEDGQVFAHFGHTACFKLYDIGDGKILSSRLLPSDGEGHGALAELLKRHGVNALICGGIGAGARTALEEAGVALYPGVTGEADAAAEAFASGQLKFDPDTICRHHHEQGHDCSSHDCRHGNCK